MRGAKLGCDFRFTWGISRHQGLLVHVTRVNTRVHVSSRAHEATHVNHVIRVRDSLELNFYVKKGNPRQDLRLCWLCLSKRAFALLYLSNANIQGG
jgi:hypothetical protein